MAKHRSGKDLEEWRAEMIRIDEEERAAGLRYSEEETAIRFAKLFGKVMSTSKARKYDVKPKDHKP